MATVALFHSVLGLRQVEARAAERMERAGHTVVVPDLYQGRVANSLEEGYALMNAAGWDVICARARAALVPLPRTAVLVGHSMGAGVIANIWEDRQECAGIVLLHGVAAVPDTARRDLPITLHVAQPDPIVPPDIVSSWASEARKAGLDPEIFYYRGVGHFYTDEAIPDFDPDAARQTWERILHFLNNIKPSRALKRRPPSMRR